MHSKMDSLSFAFLDALWYDPSLSFRAWSVVIPKSASRARIEENLDVFGWSLEARHVAALDGLDKGRHVCWSPDGVA